MPDQRSRIGGRGVIVIQVSALFSDSPAIMPISTEYVPAPANASASPTLQSTNADDISTPEIC